MLTQVSQMQMRTASGLNLNNAPAVMLSSRAGGGGGGGSGGADGEELSRSQKARGSPSVVLSSGHRPFQGDPNQPPTQHSEEPTVPKVRLSLRPLSRPLSRRLSRPLSNPPCPMRV